MTGPEVVRSVTGEQVDMERLGGPEPHGRRSGVVHVTTKDDASALAEARRLAALLGHQGRLSPADVADGTDLAALMPAEANRAYDVKPVVNGAARRARRGTARQVGAERRHRRWAASPAGPSA